MLQALLLRRQRLCCLLVIQQQSVQLLCYSPLLCVIQAYKEIKQLSCAQESLALLGALAPVITATNRSTTPGGPSAVPARSF